MRTTRLPSSPLQEPLLERAECQYRQTTTTKKERIIKTIKNRIKTNIKILRQNPIIKYFLNIKKRLNIGLTARLVLPAVLLERLI